MIKERLHFSNPGSQSNSPESIQPGLPRSGHELFPRNVLGERERLRFLRKGRRKDRSKPTLPGGDELEWLNKDEGLTYQEIAEHYETSRLNIGVIIYRWRHRNDARKKPSQPSTPPTNPSHTR